MNKEPFDFAHEEPDTKIEASGRIADFQQTLQRVDRTLEEFYQIHGPHITESGDNS